MYTANGLKKASVFIEDKIIKKIVLENNCVNRQSDECGENVELANFLDMGWNNVFECRISGIKPEAHPENQVHLTIKIKRNDA